MVSEIQNWKSHSESQTNRMFVNILSILHTCMTQLRAFSQLHGLVCFSQTQVCFEAVASVQFQMNCGAVCGVKVIHSNPEPTVGQSTVSAGPTSTGPVVFADRFRKGKATRRHDHCEE